MRQQRYTTRYGLIFPVKIRLKNLLHKTVSTLEERKSYHKINISITANNRGRMETKRQEIQNSFEFRVLVSYRTILGLMIVIHKPDLELAPSSISGRIWLHVSGMLDLEQHLYSTHNPISLKGRHQSAVTYLATETTLPGLERRNVYLIAYFALDGLFNLICTLSLPLNSPS